ncbi:uncharacterized protein PHACADRAFT_195529 [Phanerochaete carnosa HHB-10118-sp]|uniref:Nuclear rim protein 1 n=1 Tax=Phanerochaete carnosa (strain HHB-10118-sp) TaxID=650164 RepID=K5W8I4_PHACS|nr:uncharacterized protein PHACADRAFT_195529 [Phanerochaete carnosa HHB-10118-sp]EKM55495.1 hypothetical protein PHACADRAFT_195529 [Phanerochaete carnosa HHB-10118-sp]
MSGLRRFAQANHAAMSTSSSPQDDMVAPRTPIKGLQEPTTPRGTRMVYPLSPLTSPSKSASLPFDWDAVRNKKLPPYVETIATKRARLQKKAEGSAKSTKQTQKVVRKKSLLEKIRSIPSEIAFEIALLPNNVPLPTARKAAWILGGILHAVHFIIRVCQIRQVPDSDMGWEDLYREDEGESWFDWTIPVTTLLFLASLINAFYFFTRTRLYQLNMVTDPVSSPHAKFVRREGTPEPPPPPTRGAFLLSVIKAFWRSLSLSMRFLLNMSPPKDRQIASMRYDRVQQLEVWTPAEFEMTLLSIYSPVHAFLWMALTSANWIILSVIMILVGVQTRALTKSYDILIKDRAIISAEVLHEYDEKFVYPRINPLRKDQAVMTHQAEMVL